MREGKHVVLYVEDDADYQDMVREILEAADFEMVAASSAEEGIRAWEDHKPDLVIVDLMMEEVDAGTSLITDLRARGCDVPIYMLSSVGDDLALSTDYSALGLAGVFQKPINGTVLTTILKSRLS
ncbi:MAG: response regulator [marine benthic group bacterium]|jgi:DNA-binding response OmpR family regulator|nr:response regulator [Candidatus Benthicola marisminoris]